MTFQTIVDVTVVRSIVIETMLCYDKGYPASQRDHITFPN